MYISQLKKSIEHYSTIVDEICLAFFGRAQSIESISSPKLRRHIYPAGQFSMAIARNRSLEMCKNNLILMTDLDCHFTRHDINALIDNLKTYPNNGVLSIQYSKDKTDFSQKSKWYRTGNGLYFGCQDRILENKYDERFRAFWHEDSEFLMNFSRLGIIPNCVFMNYDFSEHARKQTRPHRNTNRELFERILKYGR